MQLSVPYIHPAQRIRLGEAKVARIRPRPATRIDDEGHRLEAIQRLGLLAKVGIRWVGPSANLQIRCEPGLRCSSRRIPGEGIEDGPRSGRSRDRVTLFERSGSIFWRSRSATGSGTRFVEVRCQSGRSSR